MADEMMSDNEERNLHDITDTHAGLGCQTPLMKLGVVAEWRWSLALRPFWSSYYL